MKSRFCYRFFANYDVKGVTDFLDRMAAKGWLLTKKSGVFYKFEKTDKPYFRYDITFFADASKENDYLPYGADRYFEMAEAAGWQFILNDQKMMIFISEDADAPQLETEPMVKVDVIHSSYTHFYMIFDIMFMVHSWSAYLRLTDGFPSDIRIIVGDCGLCAIGISSILNVISYFIWYFKAKKAAREGWFYHTKTPFWQLYITPVIFLVRIAVLLGIFI